MAKSNKRKKQRLSKISTRISIIGTGPASLSTALSLQQAGFTSITLYERDAHFAARKDGYGLTLTYNPSSTIQSPLQNIGLLEQVARMDCPSRAHYVFHSNGNILGYYGNAFGSGGQGQRGNLRVPRNVLRKIMMDSLLERDQQNGFARIEWGKKLVRYENITIGTGTNIVSNGAVGEGVVEGKEEAPITLHFEDGTTASTDLLIGADGVRSSVIQTLISPPPSQQKTSVDVDSHEYPLGPNTNSNSNPNGHSTEMNSFERQSLPIPEKNKDPSDLSYTGIMIVLGITKGFYHPLLDERGFYTLDGAHRLFTMPFEGSQISDLEQHNDNVPLHDSSSNIHSNIHSNNNNNNNSNMNIQRTRRYMWQLSYHLNHQNAILLSKGGSQELLKEVLTRTTGWHEPVQDMMRSTPIETIWGTPLMDRDPQKVLDKLKSVYTNQQNMDSIRTVVMGDAMHCMTPFKGQGCNQSLMDGPLLCSWLERSNLDAAVKGFMREMVQRTRKKVLASREAAKFFHSEQVLKHDESFAGVKDDCVKVLLAALKERHIGASLGESLDSRVADVIQELGLSIEDNSVDLQVCENAKEKALAFAACGDTAELRKLSMSSCGVKAICSAKRGTTGETVLHLAAKSGCYHTVKWLVSEIRVDVNPLDDEWKTPLDCIRDAGEDNQIVRLLTRLNQCDSSRQTQFSKDTM